MQERKLSRIARRETVVHLKPTRPRKRPASDTPWYPAPAQPPVRVSADQVLSEERCTFGTVFIISLDEIFRALGGRTERLVDALRFMGESTLRMRLTPDDNFSYDAAGQFRIRFRDHNPHSARVTAEMLVDELGRRAIGKRFITWESLHDDSEFQPA